MTRADIEPVLKSFKGWHTDTSILKNEADLPEVMKEYIAFINDYLGVPIKYVSNGPGRDQIVPLS
jgi:adenylosuccinate synthase